ncbi:MAG TPA: lipocalin family protein [Terriglobales bacterium]|nr:lipocalin family protein [Terriglobales bacterium]
MLLRQLAIILGVASAAFAADTAAPLQTVDRVDLNRYVGKWYEIARYPNRFEKDCVSDVTANYTLRPDGKIEVVNSCRKQDGKMKSSKGAAKVADKQTNAKLRVTFFWPFYGDYWVIGLDPEYRYAIVSEPKRKYLWILSRTSTMDPELYERALQTIREKGLDPSRMIKPSHTGG